MSHLSARLALVAAAAIVGTVVAAAHPAQAALEIQMQSGGQTYTQTGVSPVFVTNSIGNFATSFNIGVSSSAPSIDLGSSNVTASGSGTLVVSLSENNVTSPLGLTSWLSQFSGNFGSQTLTATLQTYVDSSNTLMGTGTALSTLTSTGTPFALSQLASANLSGPFAITEVLTLTASGAGSISLDGSVTNATKVPEPASLALLATSLFGIGMLRRRRQG